MDLQDIRFLQILKEIDGNQSPSQRDLARKLNISLGLVNSFIKRLAKKGYVKITTVSSNRLRYVLTPQGFGEKTRLTYKFIRYSFHFYKEALSNLMDLLNESKNRRPEKVIFYGVDDLTEIALIFLRSTNMKIIGIADDQKKGEKFFDYTIISSSELKGLEFDKILITAIESRENMFNKLLAKKIPKEKIIMLA
jgi:DNA-binding MarR family transcriptional regulator